MKAHFKELYVDLRTQGFDRTLLSTVEYYSDITKETYIVPIGFKTDLGSIPRSLQGLIPKDGRATLAYIVHDLLYKKGFTTQSQADDILEEAQNILGVNSFIKKSVRFGLFVGGFLAWNEHRLND